MGTDSTAGAQVRLGLRERPWGRYVDGGLAASGFAGVAAFLGVAALVGVVLPYYRVWDALSLGSWSRSMAETGRFSYPAVGALGYQRPLFFVLQAILWRVFGFHVVAGRLLSLAFLVVLLASLVALVRSRGLGWAVAALTAVACLLLPDVQVQAVGGLTDLPAAAMVALTAALVPWAGRRPWRAGALVLVAALATVSKSSALLALGGFVLAELLGPRTSLRGRVRAVAPVVVGVALGVVYFAYEAHAVHDTLFAFLREGTEGIYVTAAAQARGDAILGWDVVGPDISLLLAFALFYGVVRALRAPHRAAAAAAAALAIAATWVMPGFTPGGSSLGPLAHPAVPADAASLALAALLCLTVLAPPSAAPPLLRLARAAIWAAPTVVGWLVGAAYAARLVSPAWPACLLLVAETLALVLAGCRRLTAPLALAPAAALLVLLAVSFPQIDGLGGQLWHRFWQAGPSGWSNAPAMRSLALGSLDDELTLVQPQIGRAGTVVSSDGRLRFYLMSQLDLAYPSSCSQLRGHQAFVLLLDPNSAAVYEGQRKGSSSIAFWQACRQPALTLLRQVPYAFAAFAVGAPHVTGAGACGVVPPPPGLTAVFGSGLTRARAEALRRRAEAVGFKPLEVEPTSCTAYRVVLRGFTSQANASDFAAEARKAGFPVTFTGSL